jgi:hypothetical protein
VDPARIVHEGQVFSGNTELTVKTDKLVVEEVTAVEEPALERKDQGGLPGGDPAQLPRRAQRLGLPKNQEVQPAELAKGRVRRHHRISTRQSEGGEIGVHPELGRGRPARRELLPQGLHSHRLVRLEGDPVIREERLIG